MIHLRGRLVTSPVDSVEFYVNFLSVILKTVSRSTNRRHVLVVAIAWYDVYGADYIVVYVVQKEFSQRA